jgi:hypothetical protein
MFKQLFLVGLLASLSVAIVLRSDQGKCLSDINQLRTQSKQVMSHMQGEANFETVVNDINSMKSLFSRLLSDCGDPICLKGARENCERSHR